MERISELGTTLAVTSKFLMMKAIYPSYTSILTEPNGVPSQKIAFFIVQSLTGVN
jgi:hypothetical protein